MKLLILIVMFAANNDLWLCPKTRTDSETNRGRLYYTRFMFHIYNSNEQHVLNFFYVS